MFILRFWLLIISHQGLPLASESEFVRVEKLRNCRDGRGGPRTELAKGHQSPDLLGKRIGGFASIEARQDSVFLRDGTEPAFDPRFFAF